MKKILLFAVAIAATMGMYAADTIITDAAMQAAGAEMTWTSDNVYILDGFIFVGDGQSLTIEAGTLIKGKPGQEENASALIVAVGGTIHANGTKENPIVFTAEADDPLGTVADQARGLWGGVIVLGKGETSNSTATKAIEGIPTEEVRGLYGADPSVADDNSGSMMYCSIRHGGTDIGEGNEINGLTLGAVGSMTTFSYIEIAANQDDGIEFFGGAPKCDHIVVAWVGDDSYDYDEGYTGMNQFLAAIQAADEGDRLGEHDGGPSSNELGMPYSHPVFSNVTYVGRGAAAGTRTVTFRDDAGGEYMNSIFANQAKGIDIEYREDGDGSSTGQCSYSQWADAGNLKVENNIFQDVADGTGPGIFKVVSEKDDNDVELFTVPAQANTDFGAYFASAGNTVADVGVDTENPTASGDVWGASFAGMDEWFEVVDYKGAFKPNENWAMGWTLSLGDVTAKVNETSVETASAPASRVSIYPNPVAESATVEFENPSSVNHAFRLYDLSGRSVKVVDNIHESSFVLQRDDLKQGVYLYRLSNASGKIAEGKLILR